MCQIAAPAHERQMELKRRLGGLGGLDIEPKVTTIERISCVVMQINRRCQYSQFVANSVVIIFQLYISVPILVQGLATYFQFCLKYVCSMQGTTKHGPLVLTSLRKSKILTNHAFANLTRQGHNNTLHCKHTYNLNIRSATVFHSSDKVSSPSVCYIKASLTDQAGNKVGGSPVSLQTGPTGPYTPKRLYMFPAELWRPEQPSIVTLCLQY